MHVSMFSAAIYFKFGLYGNFYIPLYNYKLVSFFFTSIDPLTKLQV